MAFNLVVEDGTGVAGANSYVSKAEIDEFLLNESIAPTSNIYYLAAKAARNLDLMNDWVGQKATMLQPMEWPRKNMGACLNVYTDTIPQVLKDAQLQYLGDMAAGGGDSGVASDQAIKSKKVGNLEVSYYDSKSGATAKVSNWLIIAGRLIAPFLVGEGAALRMHRV